MHRLLPLMAQASAASFSPTDISGLVAWYDFSDITTLFQDSARTTAVTADADPIGGVTDKSGSANHLGQATDSKRATYKTGIQNGKSIARFDGVDDHFIKAAFSYSQPNTILAVVRHTVESAYHFVTDSDTGNQALYFDTSGRGVVNAGTAVTGVADLGGSPILLTAVFNGASSSLRKNAAAYVSGNANTNPFNGIYVGIASNGTSFPYDGDIDELLIYNALLSDANRDTLEAYLNTKWAVY